MLIVKQKKKVTDFVSLTCLSRHERIISDGEGREIIFIEMTTRLYKLLGVAKSASKQDIKQAYRQLALLLHPDKHAQSPKQMRDAVTEIFSQITAAHETLTERDHHHHHQSHQSEDQCKKEQQSRQSEDQNKKEQQSRQSEDQYKKEQQSRQSEDQHKKKEEENSWTRRFRFLNGPHIRGVLAVTVLFIMQEWDMVRYRYQREKLGKKQGSEVEELWQKQEGEMEELRKRQVRELEENVARHERDLKRCSTGHERAELRVAHERQLEERRARHQRQRNEQRERHQREITKIK